MAKKPKKSEEKRGPEEDSSLTKHERALLEEREVLKKQVESTQKNTRKEAGDVSFWGFAAGVGYIVDWGLFAGIGTGLAIGSAGLWAYFRSDEKKLQKRISEIDDTMLRYQEMRQGEEFSPEASSEQKPAGEEFNKTAAPKGHSTANLLQKMAEEQEAAVKKQAADKPPSGPAPR